MSWPRLRTVIFIRVHPVLGAMGLSGLELWEAEPTVWSSIFLNVPSATALRSEGEAESASILAWRSVTSTSAPGRWLLRPVSLTPSGWSRPAPRCVEGGQGQGRPGGSREPFEQRFPGRPSCRQGCEMDKLAGVDSQLVSRSFLPHSLPRPLPFTLSIEHLLGARPGPLQKLGLLSRTVLISPSSHQVYSLMGKLTPKFIQDGDTYHRENKTGGMSGSDWGII